MGNGPLKNSDSPFRFSHCTQYIQYLWKEIRNVKVYATDGCLIGISFLGKLLQVVLVWKMFSLLLVSALLLPLALSQSCTSFVR
jgi:hypothetical protein